MTGPEHYREAERILDEGVSYDNQEHNTRCDAVLVAAAQVHATLAQAAAFAEAIELTDTDTYPGSAWAKAVS
jgi:hypothetical protein